MALNDREYKCSVSAEPTDPRRKEERKRINVVDGERVSALGRNQRRNLKVLCTATEWHLLNMGMKI